MELSNGKFGSKSIYVSSMKSMSTIWELVTEAAAEIIPVRSDSEVCRAVVSPWLSTRHGTDKWLDSEVVGEKKLGEELPMKLFSSVGGEEKIWFSCFKLLTGVEGKEKEEEVRF